MRLGAVALVPFVLLSACASPSWQRKDAALLGESDLRTLRRDIADVDPEVACEAMRVCARTSDGACLRTTADLVLKRNADEMRQGARARDCALDALADRCDSGGRQALVGITKAATMGQGVFGALCLAITRCPSGDAWLPLVDVQRVTGNAQQCLAIYKKLGMHRGMDLKGAERARVLAQIGAMPPPVDDVERLLGGPAQRGAASERLIAGGTSSGEPRGAQVVNTRDDAVANKLLADARAAIDRGDIEVARQVLAQARASGAPPVPLAHLEEELDRAESRKAKADRAAALLKQINDLIGQDDVEGAWKAIQEADSFDIDTAELKGTLKPRIDQLARMHLAKAWRFVKANRPDDATEEWNHAHSLGADDDRIVDAIAGTPAARAQVAREKREAQVEAAKATAGLDETETFKALTGALLKLEWRVQPLTSDRGDGHLGAVAAAELQRRLDRETQTTSKADLRVKLKKAVACERLADRLQLRAAGLDQQCGAIRNRLDELQDAPDGSDGATKRHRLIAPAKICITKIQAWEDDLDTLTPMINEMVDIIREPRGAQ